MLRMDYLILIFLVAVLVVVGQTDAAPASTNIPLHCQVDEKTLARSFITPTVQNTATCVELQQISSGDSLTACDCSDTGLRFAFTPATGPYREPIVQAVKARTLMAGVPPPPPNDLRSTTSLPPPPSTSTPPSQTFRSPPAATGSLRTPPCATSPTPSQPAQSIGPTPALSCGTVCSRRRSQCDSL
jgi:hypothetical protein